MTRGKSPVILTAAGDTLTLAGECKNWKVIGIRVEAGSGSGAYVLSDVSGGRHIMGGTLAANGNDQATWGAPRWMDDLYVTTLPSGSIVLIDYE